MDRRKFIRNAALTTGGLLLGAEFFASGLAKKKPLVIIIGAGFAGLAAAYKLYQNQIDFVILEARNRIGGRVFSHKIDDAENLVVELGAEWVGFSHKRVIDLCDKLDLKTFNNQFATRLIYKGQYSDKGMWSYSKSWEDKFNQLKEHYHHLTDKEQKDMDKIDWWRYLNNNGCDGDDLMYRELFDSTDFGESIRHVSAYAALGEYADSDDTNEMDLKIAGGNNQLAFAIQDRIGEDKIKLQHSVDKIQQSDGKVIVTCTNGAVFNGGSIICTAPTFSVKKMKWEPPLPDETSLALDQLQYCRINKNISLYSNRFWGDESFDMMTDTEGHYFYHGTKSQPSKKGALVSYSIGDKAPVIKMQTEEWKAEMMNLSLKAAFGDTKQFLQKQVDYYWGDDPFSRGAYAMYGEGQWFDVMPKLKNSFKQTLFAGEHLSDMWQGFMEGAVETGEAAADVIINS